MMLTEIVKGDISKVYNGTMPVVRGLAKGAFYGALTPFAAFSGVRGMLHHSRDTKQGQSVLSEMDEQYSVIASYISAIGLGIPVIGSMVLGPLSPSDRLKCLGLLAATNAIDAAAHYVHSIYKRHQETSKKTFERLHKEQEEDLKRLRKCLP